MRAPTSWYDHNFVTGNPLMPGPGSGDCSASPFIANVILWFSVWSMVSSQDTADQCRDSNIPEQCSLFCSFANVHYSHIYYILRATGSSCQTRLLFASLFLFCSADHNSPAHPVSSQHCCRTGGLDVYHVVRVLQSTVPCTLYNDCTVKFVFNSSKTQL